VNEPAIKSSANVSIPNDSAGIDKRVWEAWVQKGRDRDRIRFARRVRIMKYLIAIAVLSGLIWKYLG
jgi:hypothetical protein